MVSLVRDTIALRPIGFKEGSLKRPSGPQSFCDRSTSQSAALAPFSGSQCFAIECNQAIRGSVPTLLLRSSPSAILRRVGSVVIDTIELMLGRGSLAHVSEEHIEGKPSLTDRDPTGSVAAVSLGFRVSTSDLHGFPDVVLGFKRLAMSKSVSLSKVSDLLHSFCGFLLKKASAGSNVGVSEITQTNDGRASTLASALNETLARRRSPGHGHDGEAVEHKTNHIRIKHALHIWFGYPETKQLSIQ